MLTRSQSGGVALSRDRSVGLSSSRRNQDDEEKLRRKKEKAERIGAGSARRAKRVT